MNGLDFSNPLLVSAIKAHRPSSPLFALTVCFLAMFVGLLAGPRLDGILPHPTDADAVLNLAAARAMRVVCIFAAFYAVPLGVALAWERRPAVRTPVGMFRAALLGVSSGVVGLAVALLLAAGLGAATLAPLAPLGAGTLALGVAISACITLSQAAAEEILFRYWLLPVLASRWGVWAGLGVTALLFAAAHLVIGTASPLGLLNIFLAGVLFGLLVLRTGRLSAAIGAHWAWNWCERSIAGAVPNPGIDRLGSLFNVELAGPALLGGSREGLNGAIEVSLALLLLIGLCAALPERAAAPHLWRVRQE